MGLQAPLNIYLELKDLLHLGPDVPCWIDEGTLCGGVEGDAWGYFISFGVTATPGEVLLLRTMPLLSAVSLSYASTWQKQESSMEISSALPSSFTPVSF